MPSQSKTTAKQIPFIFQGTLVDGPSINVVSFAGLKLTVEEENRLWDKTNPRDLLRDCQCVDEFEEEDDSDDMPGKGDRFFRYEATSKEQLAAELKKAILSKLGSQV